MLENFDHFTDMVTCSELLISSKHAVISSMINYHVLQLIFSEYSVNTDMEINLF